MKYSPHPIALCFPPLTEAELAELRASLKQVGLLNPIVLFENKILDGVHRDQVCEEEQIEPRYITPEIKDPIAYAIGQNRARRQLDKNGRHFIAAAFANLQRGGTGANQYQGANTSARNISSQISIPRAAELTGSSGPSISRAKGILRDGIPELVQAAKASQLPLEPAYHISKLPREKQAAALAEAKKTKPKSPKQSNNGTSKSGSLKTRLQAIDDQYLPKINEPSIYPAGLALPVHPTNQVYTRRIQSAIEELRRAEPKIETLSRRDLHSEVHINCQCIQTYGMADPSGTRVSGPIDPRFVAWAKAIAGKYNARIAQLRERSNLREESKPVKPVKKQKSEIIGFEHHWKAFLPKFKEALKVFHPDDASDVLKHITNFLKDYYKL